jgi:hypothetical protein
VSGLIYNFQNIPTPVTGDWSNVAPLGNGPDNDTAIALDGGNQPGPDDSDKTIVTAPVGQGATVIIGQSLGGDMPATDPSAIISDYTPQSPAVALDVYTGRFDAATDPLAGTSGIGGTIWNRMDDDLVAAGAQSNSVLAPIDVGGSSIAQWIPGGVYFRKLELAFKELQTTGVPTARIIWIQGEADATTMSPSTYFADFEEIVSTLRSDGITAPIYVNVNSQPGGQYDPSNAAAEAAFATEQEAIGTTLYNQNVYAGINFDNSNPAYWSVDGHFTSTGLDYWGQEWATILEGIPTIAPVADGLVSRLADGQIAIAPDNNGTLTPSWLPDNFGVAWNMVGIGDGDNLYFQNNLTDQVQVQLIQNDVAVGGGPITNQIGAGWKVVGFGDFNGDGNADIIYQQPGSAPQIQFLNGQLAESGGAPSVYSFDADWTIVGTVQANSSSETDLVLHNSQTAQYQLQFQNGLINVGGGPISSQPWDDSWTYIGAGDFRSTGYLDDLVFEQSSTGTVEIQYLNGTSSIGGGALQGNPFDDNWRAIGVQQNGIIFQRQTDGTLESVQISGTTVIGGGTYTIPPSSFSLNNMFGSHPLGVSI